MQTRVSLAKSSTSASSPPLRGRRFALAAAALALSAALSSCLSLGADAVVSSSGTVALKISCVCARPVEELREAGSLGAYGLFPLTRADLELALSKSPGAEIRSWNRIDDPESLSIAAELAFPSPGSLVSFLDPDGKRASFVQAGTNRTFTFVITEGKRVASADLSGYLGKTIGDGSLRILVQLPSAPKRVEGFTAERNLVRFERKSSELYSSDNPVRLVVVW
jgi:hypothetical protein